MNVCFVLLIWARKGCTIQLAVVRPTSVSLEPFVVGERLGSTDWGRLKPQAVTGKEGLGTQSTSQWSRYGYQEQSKRSCVALIVPTLLISLLETAWNAWGLFAVVTIFGSFCG